MPTPAYISASNFLKGVASAETAINISDVSESFSDEKMFIEDKAGSPTGFVHNFMVAQQVTLVGETNTSNLNAVMGVAFGVAETIANLTSGYGVSAGGAYADSIELSRSRGSLSTATVQFTRHPDIA
jgi:hypothetical protein